MEIAQDGFDWEKLIDSVAGSLAKNPKARKYCVLVLDALKSGAVAGTSSDDISRILEKYPGYLAKYIYRKDESGLGNLDRYRIAFFKKENNEYKTKTLNQLD